MSVVKEITGGYLWCDWWHPDDDEDHDWLSVNYFNHNFTLVSHWMVPGTYLNGDA